MPWDTAQLSNGLRLVWESSASDVVYCGYVVGAGTRHEEPADAGMAHFVEHMTFKGTARRRAHHINSYLESVGGELNAFTNKQETVFHATVMRRDFTRAADLLTDIVFHSLYPQAEIDKEVDVICDEISSYQDNPADRIFDEAEALLFQGHPLGRDVLGTAQRLHQYRTADALRFKHRYYRPTNATFFIYGNVNFPRAVARLDRLTADLTSAPTPHEPQPLPPYRPQNLTRQLQTHQAHVVIACRAVSGNDADLYPFILLNNLLGGPGMNSRLNVRLREKAGLVYSVDSYLYTYPDTGVWEVYFGCDPADATRCQRLVGRELERLANESLTPARLAAAKKQLIGQLGLSRDQHEAYALALGKEYALYGRHRDLQRTAQAINAVTAQQLQDVAQRYLQPENLTTLRYS